MNTTLDPKPTDREREMLAEWVGIMAHVNEMGNNTGNVFQYAETMLMEFRSRYGVTGAEPEPIREAADNTLKEAIEKIQQLIDEGGYGASYTSGMRLCVSILKGGGNGNV